MSDSLTLLGLLLIGGAVFVGIFLGWDKVPLSITACGLAIAGGLSILGGAVVKAAQIRTRRE
jgi:hypothetical protein